MECFRTVLILPTTSAIFWHINMSRERQNGSEVASSSSQAKSRQNPESPGAASPPSSPASNSTTADSQHPLTASVSHTEGKPSFNSEYCNDSVLIQLEAGNPKKILLRRILDFLCGPSDPAGAPGTPRYTLKYRVPELVRSGKFPR